MESLLDFRPGLGKYAKEAQRGRRNRQRKGAKQKGRDVPRNRKAGETRIEKCLKSRKSRRKLTDECLKQEGGRKGKREVLRKIGMNKQQQRDG